MWFDIFGQFSLTLRDTSSHKSNAESVPKQEDEITSINMPNFPENFLKRLTTCRFTKVLICEDPCFKRNY